MSEDRYVEINNDLWHYIRDRDTFAKYDFNEVVDLLNMQEQRIEALESAFIKDLEAMHNDCMKCEKEYEERIKELEDKLNQTALFFLNYNMISMGKAVEISEMSYHDFLKYRKENGNPMELQL